MAVSVRIEDEAFSDRRYDVLAAMLGLPDADCARGKMASVWRQCTQQQTHVLSAELVRAVLGQNGPDALIKSELGVAVDGGIRIRGCKGRIEWLAKLRKNARKGGAATSAKRHSKKPPTGSDGGVPDGRPPAPAPAPANKEEDPLSDRGLALSLIRRILQNNPSHRLGTLAPAAKESKLRSWADDIRLMREQDNRTPTGIAAVIAWCQSDPFWKTNILSAAKLRDKFDALAIKMGGSPGAKVRKFSEQPSLEFPIGDCEVLR